MGSRRIFNEAPVAEDEDEARTQTLDSSSGQ